MKLTALQIRHILLWSGTVLTLIMINSSIMRTEALIANGRPVLLEIAPVDPRSLIQGDFMRLGYRLERDLRDMNLPREGQLVLRLDENNVAQFVRLYEAGEPLAEDEILLHYRTRNGSIQVAPDAFFFQEGQGEAYEAAEYVELRVTATGETVLVDLRDENFRPIEPPEN